jgi:hypothetical protein
MQPSHVARQNPFPARRLACRLRLLAVIEHAHHGLQVPLRLHVAEDGTSQADSRTINLASSQVVHDGSQHQ